jgi:P pilus assembly chaperone PapD
MKKSLSIILCSISVVANAENNSPQQVSGSFTIFPVQVVFTQPGKVQELSLINTGQGILNTQSKLLTYNQSWENGRLIEKNLPISGAPAVISTPVVIANVQPNAKQAIRLLATHQDESKEIVYRYYVKNLVPQSVDSSGTTFEVQYGMPVFVLPKNVIESYNFSYIKQNGKSYLKVANLGNVHLVFKKFALKVNGNHFEIGSIGRLLAGDYGYIEIPKSVAAAIAKHNEIEVLTNKSKLVEFEETIPVTQKISLINP